MVVFMASSIGARNRHRIQRALELRDGLLCFYCGIKLVWASSLKEPNVQPDRDSRPIATIDHLQPLSRGGRNVLNNMIIACRPCHNQRHAK